MEEEQREPTLPSNRKKVLDLLGMTPGQELEAFSARLLEYETALITLLMTELDEAEGEPRSGETPRLSSCRSPAGTLTEAQVHARCQEAIGDYLTQRALLKAALKQILAAKGGRHGGFRREE